jgi:hypothetical protein
MSQEPSSHWEDIRMQRFRYFTTMDADREIQEMRSDGDQDKECDLDVVAE